MTDTSQYKHRLKDYLRARGINIVHTDADRISCLIPGHDDSTPSAIVYDEVIHCPVCSINYDVFECAGYIAGASDFPSKLKEVQNALGDLSNNLPPVPPKEQKTRDRAVPVPLTHEEAKEKFSKSVLLGQSEFLGKKAGEKKGLTLQGEAAMRMGYGDKITGAWPYKNADGMVEVVDIRFEGGPRAKNVVTFYWDGKHVKSKNAPVCVFNRDLLQAHTDAKFLIVEGAKTAKAAEALIPFGIVPVTWNGGTAKITMADWSCLEGRDGYMLPDDDEPGIKAAKKLPVNGVKIIPPYEPAREIKAKGADIVEILQLISPEELADYIKNSEPYAPSEEKPKSLPPPPAGDNIQSSDGAFPFRILGIAEDNLSYFLDRSGRLYTMKLDSISKNKLLSLAPLSFWQSASGSSRMSADDWLFVQDELMEVVSRKDFLTDRIRGRGCWKEDDGRLCYHDGHTTIGEYDKERWVFLKKPAQPIGLDAPDISIEQINEIKKACFALSFETHADAARMLAWSVLAPFSGALEWRPQAFLTGPSSSGKSSIESNIVKVLASPDRYNGGKTSAAGYMQFRRKDCGAVVIEEADPDTEKKKNYRDDLLSVMRQSTSDDTPKSAMGTADQTGTSYMTRDMFLFIAISPEVESVADDNRLTRINLTKPVHGGPSWGEIKGNLNRTLTPEAAASIRAMVWRNLAKIKHYAGVVSDHIQEITGKDHRFAISEGTLISCYMIIWRGIAEPTADEIREFIKGNYSISKPEDDRDDSAEMVERIMMHTLRVTYNDKMREFNVLEALKIVNTGEIETGETASMGGRVGIDDAQKQEFKRALNINGIGVDPEGRLAIANNHTGIKRITGRAGGYKQMLWRHKECLKRSENVVFVDKTWRCTIIDNIVDEIPF